MRWKTRRPSSSLPLSFLPHSHNSSHRLKNTRSTISTLRRTYYTPNDLPQASPAPSATLLPPPHLITLNSSFSRPACRTHSSAVYRPPLGHPKRRSRALEGQTRWCVLLSFPSCHLVADFLSFLPSHHFFFFFLSLSLLPNVPLPLLKNGQSVSAKSPSRKSTFNPSSRLFRPSPYHPPPPLRLLKQASGCI